MKKILNLSALTLALLLIFNCSKEKYTVEKIEGVKYYKNSGVPTGHYKPAEKFLFEITGPENVPDSMKGFGVIADVLCDERDNIYILDSEHATIKKYNGKGEFERYFPEQRGGTELDQLKKPSQFAALYDTLIVIDNEAKKYVRFLNNGQFLNANLRLMGGVSFLFLNSDQRDNLSAFVPTPIKIDSLNYFSNDLCLLNSRLKPEKVIKQIRVLSDSNFFFPDIFSVYTAKNDIFYIADNKGDYTIYAINGRGQTKYTIEKGFDKIPYNTDEKELLNEFVTSSGYPAIDKEKQIYKKAINSIEIDKNDKLWIMPSVERNGSNADSLYIDIFENGVFVNRTVLDFVKGDETYKLKGNRLYVISSDRKSVRVYDYE
ncbi:MAG: hypothetical protein PHF33_07095 [Candidatus Delongbacteria bacterium]|nr:hypothetical protein [Candidatus Delongbacteria bacterium]